MPRGDKSSYTDKQKRQAQHIEEGYEHRGVPEKEAERRGWGHRQQAGPRWQEERVGRRPAEGHVILAQRWSFRRPSRS
jgi:hypothetical protein